MKRVEVIYDGDQFVVISADRTQVFDVTYTYAASFPPAEVKEAIAEGLVLDIEEYNE